MKVFVARLIYALVILASSPLALLQFAAVFVAKGLDHLGERLFRLMAQLDAWASPRQDAPPQRPVLVQDEDPNTK